MTRKVSSNNLTRRLVETLGIAIVTGVYGPERPFPTEAQLCIELEASRSVLREAVKMLTAKGLLSARPRRGTVVEPEGQWNLLDPDVLRWMLERKFSLEVLAEFTQMRLAIEPRAAMLAAHRADPEALQAIERSLVRMRAAERGEDDALESDIAFHVAVLLASGNRLYAQLRDLVATALRFSIPLTNRAKGVALANVADHRRVYAAIVAGDGERAQKGMHALLLEVMELIEAQPVPGAQRRRRKA
ncbi:FadR/GntR family transcriptional regulator [Solilutibacter silvestris]|uniref:Transcriptional regulator n=1 Tax=Solilutibacter silvestris TaxID=1645665 RepID=A0A2K1Q0G6_9GAMM|nr:FadR/GntR family transcriptional regulator [Lysobacter silvestris]PNS08539.1 Transcriptional regulator [Lysobacter silvestris]